MNTIEKAIARAEPAVASYHQVVGWGSYEEILSDLLADLMHLVDALQTDREIGESFDQLLARAEMNYTAEKEEGE